MADCSTTGHSSPVHNFEVNGYCHSWKRCLCIIFLIQIHWHGDSEWNCGLFALASAAALANGEEPGSFAFDQEQMQPHLIKCLAAEKGEPFPVKKCRRKLKKIKSTVKVPVFCTCHMPKRSDCTMIECSACRELFHVDICVDVNTCAFDHITKWLCTSYHV